VILARLLTGYQVVTLRTLFPNMYVCSIMYMNEILPNDHMFITTNFCLLHIGWQTLVHLLLEINQWFFAHSMVNSSPSSIGEKTKCISHIAGQTLTHILVEINLTKCVIGDCSQDLTESPSDHGLWDHLLGTWLKPTSLIRYLVKA